MVKQTKITIKDKFGTKIYNFSENFVFEFKFMIFVVIVSIITLIVGIFLLRERNIELKDEISTLESKVLSLNNHIKSLNSNIEQNNKALDISNDKIEDLKLEILYSQTYDKKDKNYEEDIKIPTNLSSLFFRFIPNGMPLQSQRITSAYGMRVHPISGVTKKHDGIDLSAPIGTPIIAPADGFVEYSAMSNTGYGYLVILSHNYGFKTRFGHLLDKTIVNAGQFVKKGQIIGFSGNTGYSTGPHLHYEVRFLERTLNPYNFMNWNANNFTSIFSLERMVPWRSIAMELSV